MKIGDKCPHCHEWSLPDPLAEGNTIILGRIQCQCPNDWAIFRWHLEQWVEPYKSSASAIEWMRSA